MKNILYSGALICGIVIMTNCGQPIQSKVLPDDSMKNISQDDSLKTSGLSKEMISLPLYELSDLDDYLVIIDIPDTALASQNKTLHIGLEKSGELKIQIDPDFQILIEKYPGKEKAIDVFKNELVKRGLQKFKYIVEESDAVIYQWDENGQNKMAMYSIIEPGHGYSFKIESINDNPAILYNEEDMMLMLKSAKSMSVRGVRN
jgi:hypothetical protein